jgi:hypothetical protein
MDVQKIIGELVGEVNRLHDAIEALERLQEGRGKRRGRKPSWMIEARKQGVHKSPARSKPPASAAVSQ